MPRRTKEEALATRDALLDAAEAVFEARGVAGATLGHIAAAAGVTRGAVYWHFRDKADLLQTMLARAAFPFEQQWRAGVDGADPLGQLERTACDVLRRVAAEPRLQCLQRIVGLHDACGDVGAPIVERHRLVRAAFQRRAETLLRRARRAGQLRSGVVVRHAAIGLQALLDGLVRGWIAEPDAFDLPRAGRCAVAIYLEGLRRESPR